MTSRQLQKAGLPPVSELTEIAPAPVRTESATSGAGTDEPPDPWARRRDAIRLALIRTHKYSSYVFSAFLSLHAVNVVVLPAVTGSTTAADDALVLTRVFYQATAVEPVAVFGALAAHAAAGALLRALKVRRDRRWYAQRQKMTRVAFAGYLLVPVTVAHVALARVVPARLFGDSSIVSLRLVSHGFARHRLLSWTVYTALVGLTAFHVIGGWARWLRLTRRKTLQALTWSSAAVGMLALRVVSRQGAAAPWLARRYDDIYRTQVVRWGAFASGIVYGAYHSFSLSSAAKAHHAAAEYAHQEALIKQAKEEYAKLHPKPVVAVSSAAVETDISSPNFDLEKFLDYALKE
ncbi:ATP synthase E chain-domain-containing protein [Dipodascopsis tothii]|uniref:ATP synthase E chain-domain-containing protein n=1 Tax=Dipodascopsis tothii TaxID=44089 RepID=UPI0034CF2C6D